MNASVQRWRSRPPPCSRGAFVGKRGGLTAACVRVHRQWARRRCLLFGRCRSCVFAGGKCGFSRSAPLSLLFEEELLMKSVANSLTREQRVERHLHRAARLLWAALARWIRRRQRVRYTYLTHRQSFYILNFFLELAFKIKKKNWLSAHFEDPVFLEHRFLQCQRLN